MTSIIDPPPAAVPADRPSAEAVVDLEKPARRSLLGGASPTGHGSWIARMVLLSVAVAAVSALVCLAIAALIWVTTPHDSTSLQDALRAGGLAWIASQGAAITINAVTIGLAPWGLGLVSIVLFVVGARRIVRPLTITSVTDVVWLVAAIVASAVTYAILASWAVDLSWRPDARAAAVDTAVRAGALALISAGAGAFAALHEDEDDRESPRRRLVPPIVGTVARAGAIGAVLVLGLGALAGAVSLLGHFDEAVTITQSIAGGLGGGLGLVLLCLAFVPVLVVWGAAYVLGAGVVIGPGVTATPFMAVTAPTSLPAVPLLAAVPQQASPLAWLLPVAVIACGLLVGLSITRAQRGTPRLARAGLAVVAAAVSGLLLALAAVLASGSLGDQRLAHVGPVPMTVGVLCFVLIVLGAVPAALLGAERGRATHLRVATPPAGSDPSEEVGQQDRPEAPVITDPARPTDD